MHKWPPPADPAFPYADLGVYIYRRASQDQHKRETSVEAQETAGQLWCADARARHVRSYTDNDLSASRFATKDRADFERLMRDLPKGEAKILWMLALARSQRDLEVYAKLRNLCRSLGIRWVVEGRVYNLDDKGDRMALNQMAMADEELPESISLSSRLGIARNAARGLPHGFSRFGFERIYHEKTKTFLEERVVPSEAELLIRGWNWVDSGKPLRTFVREEINDKGILSPAGKVFSVKSFRTMLLNPAYIGERYSRGTHVTKAVWNGIIEPNVFWRVHERLSSEGRDCAPGVPRTARHLLVGIMRCSICEKPAYVTGSPTGTRSYGCRPKKHSSAQKEPCEAYITDVLIKRLSKPDALAVMASRVSSTTVVEARNTMASKLKTLKEYRDLVKAGRLSPAGLAEVEPDLLASISDAEKVIAIATLSPALHGAVSPDLPQRWNDETEFPLARKRAVLQAVMSIKLRPAGRGCQTFDPIKRFEIKWHHPNPEAT